MSRKEAVAAQDGQPSWLAPGEPLPVRLMNTIWADRHGVHDALTTRGHLGEWFRIVGLSTDQIAVTEADLKTARRLRDALRRLAALLTEDSRPAATVAGDLGAAVRQVNSVASVAPGHRLRLSDGALVRDTAPSGRSARATLAAVATEAIDLLTGPDAQLLRACYAPGCVIYFVKDHPRREWCSTACGNRVRAARHYARRIEGRRSDAHPG
jgi:predicted RNA-binding Zn ribbon-like protein